MKNDELLRLASQWTTLTEPAQVALAAEMEKRNLENEFRAERQSALEKPSSPPRNKLRTTWVVVIATAVGALIGFLNYFEQNPTTAVSERYHGGNLTMVVPAGSTPVKVQSTTRPVGEQQMVQTSYSFRNNRVSYSIYAYEYSNHAENTPEEVSRAMASQILGPGYSANFHDSHLGSLPATACELQGTTIKGKIASIRTRLAISDDRKLAWMSIVVASDGQPFPTEQAEEFMERIEVNSR